MNKDELVKQCSTFWDMISKDKLYAVKPEQSTHIKTLESWISLLPVNISNQIQAALDQKQPFLSNDVTLDVLEAKNEHLPGFSHLTLLYTIMVHSLDWEEYRLTSAVIFVVDRACYRYNTSPRLFQILDYILHINPDTPTSPQVIIRKARFMKDTGDLHGSMHIINSVENKDFKWDYKTTEQFDNVKAVCVQMKGQIYHNLGLWKDAITPLVESSEYFEKLADYKGLTYSYGLMTRCLAKLTLSDFHELKLKYPMFFKEENPYYQGYQLSLETVNILKDKSFTELLFTTRHQLSGDQCLLMYATQEKSLNLKYKMFQTIVDDIKSCLALYREASSLKVSENIFEFIRSVFMISQTLSFSSLHQDTKVAQYLEQMCIELYGIYCRKVGNGHDMVKFINGVLTILGLTELQGTDVFMKKVDTEPKLSTTQIRKGFVENITVELKYCTLPTSTSSIRTSPIKQSSTVPDSNNDHFLMTNPRFLTRFVGLSSDPNVFCYSKWSYVRPSGDQEDNIPPLVDMSVTSLSQTTNSSGSYSHRLTGVPLDASNKLQHGSKCSGNSEDPSFEKVYSKDNSSTSSFEKVSSKDNSSTSSFEKVSSKDPSSTSSFEKVSSKDNSSMSSFEKVSSKDNSSASSFENMSTKSDSGGSIYSKTTTSIFSEDTNESDIPSELVIHPLIDIGNSEVLDKFTDLNLGKSSSLSSSTDYLMNWEVPTTDESELSSIISRAQLLTYNAVSGQWTPQSTLASIGSEVKLADDKKGNFRDVYEVSFLHQDEPLGRYVCKKYRRQQPPVCYMQDVICQMVAGYYVTKFNDVLVNYNTKMRVQFLPVAHLQLLTHEGLLTDWVNVEPYLHGTFNKLTNNWSFINNKMEDGLNAKDLATALSHFSYVESNGALMIVDIQGWLPNTNTGIIYLTDPQFHTSGIEKFSKCDHQEKGMEKFWKHVHISCNDICKFLHLKRPDIK